MEQLVNKNLITLKCVLFCFLAGFPTVLPSLVLILVLPAVTLGFNFGGAMFFSLKIANMSGEMKIAYSLPHGPTYHNWKCFLISCIGCIFPFLPLHMLAVGLDRGEARLISAVAPCVALLGPAILGPLIDKLSVGRGSTGGGTGPSGSGRLLRVVTAVCLLLSAVFYTLLLAVPHTERHEARRPQVLFMCDAAGAYVMQEVCEESMRCNRWEGEKSGVLAVNACEYGCADDNLTWVKQEFTTTSTTSTTSTLSPMYNSVANATPLPDLGVEESEDEDYFELNPPHLCTSGQCLVYMQHDARLRLPLVLLAPDPPAGNATGEDKWCTYRTGSPSKCVVPPSRLSAVSVAGSSCRAAVRCRVLDPYDEPGGVLAQADCRRVRGDPATTLWTYFLIRVLADIWPTAALALLGAACVIATRETSLGRGDVGRQLAFGTMGLAIFPPIAGYAADQMPESPYLVPFVMHAVFMIIGAIILLLDTHMPLSTPEWWWHTATGVLALPMSAVRRYGAETAALGAVLALLGALWGALDAYLPWTVVQLNGTLTDMGLTLTAGALPALPALYWAEALVDYVGHSNLFITAFTFYCLRYTGLAYSESYTWIVVCELLEVFTLSLVWVTAMLYFRHLVPRKYTTTGQALPVIAHFCIGRCLGAIVGGLVSLEESPRALHRGLGVLALLAAAVYLALYHLLLAPRCAAPTHAPPKHLLQGLNTNGGSNGNYSPMRVYHEERSRKGHFRY